MNNILNSQQIAKIKVCGQKLARSLDKISESVKPGLDVMELELLACDLLEKENCRPSFKNYLVEGIGHYPTALCVSINDEIVHGIPKQGRILNEGDIVSLDFGAEYEGVYTDMAITLPVGKISDTDRTLLENTKAALYLGIDQAKAGNHIGDIGKAVESWAKEHELGIVRDYVGHGIGEKPHLPPQIPNFGVAGTGQLITEGMALAIEPMLTLGGERTKVAPDRWTVLTADGSRAAHFEHTIVIENGKPAIVTML